MRFSLLLLVLLLLTNVEIIAQDKWEAPAEADTLKNPYSLEDSDVINKGEDLFLNWCSSCHGLEGRGDGPAGQAFNPPPADFTDKLIQQQSDGALFWKLMTGNPPTMLSYQDILSKEEAWQIVTYLRELGNN